MTDRKIIDAHGKYLARGTGLSQEEHVIREQAYEVESKLQSLEVEAGNTDQQLREFDIVEILYALAQWGNKEKGYWEKKISAS